MARWDEKFYDDIPDGYVGDYETIEIVNPQLTKVRAEGDRAWCLSYIWAMYMRGTVKEEDLPTRFRIRPTETEQ